MQLSGNRTANQRTNAEMCESTCLLNHRPFRHYFSCLADDLPGFGLDDVNMPRSIENRGDSLIPISKSCFHISSLAPFNHS
jgi:hypothetical protein